MLEMSCFRSYALGVFDLTIPDFESVTWFGLIASATFNKFNAGFGI